MYHRLTIPTLIALVALSGAARANGLADDPVTARGNEPFWTVSVADGDMHLDRLGHDPLFLPVAARDAGPGGRLTIRAQIPGQSLRLVTQPGLCRDSMSGQVYPAVAELSMGDTVMTGCAGRTEDLLLGVVWRVVQIDGQDTLDGTEVTLEFGPDGRLAGSAGCNRFRAAYSLTGEGLQFGPSAATRMACPQPIMDQEQRLLTALGTVIRLDIEDTGALLLLSPDGAAQVRALADG